MSNPGQVPCEFIQKSAWEVRTDACVDGHEDDARRRGHLLAHPEEEAEHGERAEK